jgi:hypothetical protein
VHLMFRQALPRRENPSRSSARHRLRRGFLAIAV